ncbi:MAG: transketolase [Patescibacteria group bacterium]|nr:transketolase [Patescibacteria group bacterium]
MFSGQLDLSQLKTKAQEIRIDLIKMLFKAGSGHTAGPLGMADIFTALYFSILNHDPKNPAWPDRDRLILSNGHICPVLYATLAHAGYFKIQELMTLRQLDSRLQGHPNRLDLPGLETSSGPLAQGISQAVGFALAAKIDKKNHHNFCLMGDGELDEGLVWEAFMFGAKEKLGNLIAIIDRNHIQLDGTTEEIMPLEPLKAKLASFNWLVMEMDGHNFEDILSTLMQAKVPSDQPVAIIAHTIPGKGVSFMECKSEWHGKTPNIEETKLALQELSKL